MTETDPDSPTPRVSPLLAARWRQAESQLFGGLVMDPERYEQVVRVLAATTDRLRGEEASTQALLAATDTITTTTLELAGSLAVGLDAAGAEQIGLTALSMRLREVVVAERAQGRVARLAAARADAGGWVVLEESGDRSGSPYAPYRRLEAEAATGRALLVRAEPDDRYETSVHRVDLALIDLQTGRLTEVAHDLTAAPQPDAEQRESLADRLRGA